jgi:hypothetical protein
MARGQNETQETAKKNWLVVSTPLKDISQLGLLFPIYGKTKCSKAPSRK